MFLISADIIARSIFESPIRGVTELVSLTLVTSVFLQLMHAVRLDKLTRTDVLTGFLNKTGAYHRYSLRLITCLLSIFVLLTLCNGIWPDLARAVKSGEFVGVEGLYTISIWPIKLIIFIGTLFALFEYLRQGWLTTQQVYKLKQHIKSGVAVIIFIVGTLVFLYFLSSQSDHVIGISMIGYLLLIILLGSPISISLLVTGLMGISLLKGGFNIATLALAMTVQSSISEYVFAAVPLFVLMGMFVGISEIGRDSFRFAQQIFGSIRGGLGVANVAANSIFAAVTGISIASAAIFTRIAVPEMVKHGYQKRFAVGLTAGSSVLGMLIPPSLLLIVYGVIAEVSIGKLFVAGIIPGVLLALAFSVGVILMAKYWPDFVGKDLLLSKKTNDENEYSISGLASIVLLVTTVLGGIYGGVFTPTEAGAAGAMLAMLISILRNKLSLTDLWRVIGDAGQISVTILFLIISASVFSKMLTLTGLPNDIVSLLADTDLSLFVFMLCYLFLLIILGTVLDSTSILLILLPLVVPVATAMGCDLIWFGIITVIGVEIGLMTPPLGLSVYVIKSSLDDETISLNDIFYGALPFVLITLVVSLVLIIFPGLTLFLLAV
jgi:tripartite ATP-independent transporter DctM subunit